jgi:hypothetical protein
MKEEAASNGFYESPGWKKSYPKLQLLTIEELLKGKQIDMPPVGEVNVTFKKAERVEGKGGVQGELNLGRWGIVGSIAADQRQPVNESEHYSGTF